MNPLRHRLWLDHLLLQAPMAGSQGSALALAVCEAGGHRGMFLATDPTTQLGGFNPAP